MGFNWKAEFVGDGERYDYSSMCLPSLPWSSGEKKQINFYLKGNCDTFNDLQYKTSQCLLLRRVFHTTIVPAWI
jgi:hypothetical protein